MSDVVLIQGDCLEKMKKIPDKSIDMILTDPPYENDNHGGGKTELAQRKLVKDLHIDFMSKGFNYDACFKEMLRICKTPNFLIFCSNKQITKIMSWFETNAKNTSVTLLVWNKTNPSPLCNGKYLSDIEFIVYVRGKVLRLTMIHLLNISISVIQALLFQTKIDFIHHRNILSYSNDTYNFILKKVI